MRLDRDLLPGQVPTGRIVYEYQGNQGSVEMRTLLENFGNTFPLEMGLMRKVGVYPGEKKNGRVNWYTNEVVDDYRGNIGEHCVSVAYLCGVLGRVFNVNGIDITKAMSKGLLHDIPKQFEIDRRDAARKGLKTSDWVYSKEGYESVKILFLEAGFSLEEIGLLLSTDSDAGHFSIPNFVKLEGGEPVLATDNIARLIVHLADYMTSTSTLEGITVTNFVTLGERRKDVEAQKRKYSHDYSWGFGFDESGKLVLNQDVEKDMGLANVKSIAEWDKWIAKKTCEYLVSRITSEESENPELLVKDTVNRTIDLCT